jgi:hypothetical protein
MHLPDPSYVTLSTAVLTFLTAATGVIRLVLEKKFKSVPVEQASKKTGNRLTHNSVVSFLKNSTDARI